MKSFGVNKTQHHFQMGHNTFYSRINQVMRENHKNKRKKNFKK